MTVLALLLACAGETTLDPGLGACADFDYDNPAPSVLSVTWLGEEKVIVARTNVLQPDGNLAFTPEIVAEGDVISVYEGWTLPTGEEGDGLEFCFLPQVDITGPVDGMQLRWFYAVGDTIPFASVNLEAPEE
jgi:hypothetical protein